MNVRHKLFKRHKHLPKMVKDTVGVIVTLGLIANCLSVTSRRSALKKLLCCLWPATGMLKADDTAAAVYIESQIIRGDVQM